MSLPLYNFLTKNYDPRFYPSSLLEAAGESRAGRVFFRFLFDQLTPGELRDALLESVDGDLTLLHHVLIWYLIKKILGQHLIVLRRN